MDRIERRSRHASSRQGLADLGEAAVARHHAEIVGRHRQRVADRLLVAVAEGGHHGEARPLGRRVEARRPAEIGDHLVGLRKELRFRGGIDRDDRIAHGFTELRQRPGGGRDAEDHEARRRQDGLEIDLHGPSAVAGHGKHGDARAPLQLRIGSQDDQPRLPFGERPLRLADHRRLRATAAEEAVEGARRRDQCHVSGLRRAGRLPAHHDGQHEGLLP